MSGSRKFRPVAIRQRADGSWVAINAVGDSRGFPVSTGTVLAENDRDPESGTAETTNLGTTANESSRLREGIEPGPVVITLASRNCFLAQLPADGVDDLDPTTLAYLIEDQLPIAAEEMAAAVVGTPQADGLVVAIETPPIEAVVQACEARGLFPVAILPTALLLSSPQAGTERPAESGSEISDSDEAKREQVLNASLIEDQDDGFDLVVADSTGPRHWISASAAEGLAPVVSAIQRFMPRHVTAVVSDSSYRTLSAAHAKRPAFDRIETTVAEAIAQKSVECLRSRREPIVDLRVGPLAPKSVWQRYAGVMSLAVLFAAVAVLSVGTVCFLRANAYADWSNTYRERQLAAYRRVFPERPVPLRLQAGLEQELAEVRARLDNPVVVPDARLVRTRVREFLSGLDSYVSVNLVSLEATSWKTSVQVEVRSPREAEWISAGFAVRGHPVTNESINESETNSVWVCTLGAFDESLRDTTDYGNAAFDSWPASGNDELWDGELWDDALWDDAPPDDATKNDGSENESNVSDPADATKEDA